MFLNIDWKGLLKAILKAALPFLLGGAIGVTASGCSSLQTPRTKTQTSAIYAFGLPAIVVTHDATQTADYSGGDTNETMQSNKQESGKMSAPKQRKRSLTCCLKRRFSASNCRIQDKTPQTMETLPRQAICRIEHKMRENTNESCRFHAQWPYL